MLRLINILSVSLFAFGFGLDENDMILYLDISLANRTDSLNRIKNIPISTYEFKYDKISGRRQMGVLGKDATKWLPDAIEVVRKYAIPHKDRSKPPIELQNFPIIDKNALFMHGVAALQQLLIEYDSLLLITDTFKQRAEEVKRSNEDLEKRFLNQADSQLLEQKQALIAELDYKKRELDLNSAKSEEEKKRIEVELSEEKILLDYQEELSRSRMSLQEHLARESMLKSIEIEKELAERREVVRRENAEKLQLKKIEYLKELEARKAEFEKEKIRAEVEAKAAQERANEDIALRKLQAQAKLDTQRTIESIKMISNQLTQITAEFLSRPQQILTFFGAIFGIFAIYYAFRQFVFMLREFIQSRLGKPCLVRETSYSWSIIPPFLTLSWWWRESIASGLKRMSEHFADIILSDDDRERVLQLALSTRNTKLTCAPYRHVLLYGPAGTGKTLIARQLAVSSGMDYAIMSGGDVGPLGEDAVDQLHGLFRWASRSNGLLLFIDEAEAFLSRRTAGSATGAAEKEAHIRNALNALLYQTGSQSRQFMMVLATNRPEDLDAAVLDRIDISLYIGLPGATQRYALAKLYFRVHVEAAVAASRKRLAALLGFSRKCRIESGCCDDEHLKSIADRCVGFSGRGISKFFVAAQYAMLLNNGQVLTKQLLEATLDSAVSEQRQKMRYSNDAAEEVAVPPGSVKSDIDNTSSKALRGRGVKA